MIPFLLCGSARRYSEPRMRGDDPKVLVALRIKAK